MSAPKQQTAVEWFADKINDIIFDGLRERVELLKNEAKAMEKEQIMETWKHGNLPTFLGRQLTAEQYYKETYH